MKRTNRKYPSNYIRASYDDKQAAYRSSDPKLLSELANSPYYSVRSSVAFNIHTPLSVLEKLANDEDDYVRSNVSANPNTPPELLAKMANNGDCFWSLAHNRNTPSEALAKIAKNLKDPEDMNIFGVVDELLRNPNTPVDVIKYLIVNGFHCPRFNDILNLLLDRGKIDPEFIETLSKRYKNSLEDEYEDEYEDEGFSRGEAISSIASTLGVPEDIADTIYDWYDSEGSVDDYTNVDDFVDYVSDDIYDMLDACTDTELRKEIGGYLGVDYYDEDDEDY